MAKKQAVWETEAYYQQAHEAGKAAHPGLLSIKERAKESKKILEVGCGEGSKLALVVPLSGKGFGVDISQTAIVKARQQYPRFQFQVADAEKLPLANNQFDLVFSAFTLEHLQNPEKVIKEMVRVLKPQGILALLAPNYGAPNRASPCFRGSRVKKLFFGLARDYYRLLHSSGLKWQKVKPKAEPGKYEIDWDTTVEPYLGSLLTFLASTGIKPQKVSGFWGIESKLPWRQKPLAVLGKLRLYPFKYWGPHLFILGTKEVGKRSNRGRKILTVILLFIAFLLPLTIPLLFLGVGAWIGKRFLAKR